MNYLCFSRWSVDTAAHKVDESCLIDGQKRLPGLMHLRYQVKGFMPALPFCPYFLLTFRLSVFLRWNVLRHLVQSFNNALSQWWVVLAHRVGGLGIDYPPEKQHGLFLSNNLLIHDSQTGFWKINNDSNYKCLFGFDFKSVYGGWSSG